VSSLSFANNDVDEIAWPWIRDQVGIADDRLFSKNFKGCQHGMQVSDVMM
jgi:hypothetical protein